MNTAALSRKKKLLSLVLTLVFLLTCLPAAFAVDLNVDAGFYFKQSRGGTCTLASAAMMLRRRAYFDGLTDWSSVTENSVRGTAWANGLSHSFTYKEMQVGYATLPSSKVEKIQTLITLLSQHPEGIVLYDRSQPHAVLLTDYTNGVFHCSDPAGNISSGRIPLTSSSVSVNGASCYWYVTSDHNSVASAADGLRLEGMSYPVNIQVGKGMALTGTANSAKPTREQTMRVFKNPSNWLVSVALIFFNISIVSFSAYVIVYMGQRGIPAAEAGPLYSYTSLIGIFAMLAFGWLADKFGTKRKLAVFSFFTGIIALLLLVHVPIHMIWIYIVVFGTLPRSVAGMSQACAPDIAEMPMDIPVVNSFRNTVSQLGNIAGGIITGYLLQYICYTNTIYVLCVLMALGGVCWIFAKKVP